MLRTKKIKLIEEFNNEWDDLYMDGIVRYPSKIMKNFW